MEDRGLGWNSLGSSLRAFKAAKCAPKKVLFQIALGGTHGHLSKPLKGKPLKNPVWFLRRAQCWRHVDTSFKPTWPEVLKSSLLESFTFRFPEDYE